MHNQTDGVPTDPNSLQLKAEIKEWAFGIRCVFMVLHILPLFFCTTALRAAPRFETIFEDMLGSKQKLPVLTLLVIDHAAALLALVWLLAVLSVVLIFVLKRARQVWITALLTSFVLVISALVFNAALFLPLTEVIKNLSGGEISP